MTYDFQNGYDSSYFMLKNREPFKTPMLQLYAQPGKGYITRYVLEKAGIKIPTKSRKRSKALDPITCPQSSPLNPAGKRFCGQSNATSQGRHPINRATP
jgi:hypothetical protein